MFLIIATRSAAAEEFRIAAILRSYIIQKPCRHRNCAFLQHLSSYVTQSLKISTDIGAYVPNFGASAVFF